MWFLQAAELSVAVGSIMSHAPGPAGTFRSSASRIRSRKQAFHHFLLARAARSGDKSMHINKQKMR
jgi:hypothetical protein